MANSEHLEILKRSVEQWNHWRTEHPEIKPDLLNANLSGADLSGVDLSGVDLSGADLSGADLSRAILIEAILSEANLSGADLREARLSGADLSEAKLRWVDLRKVTLSGVNLSGADLSGADLSGAVISERTKYRRAKGCTKGVNGFYSEKTDSAALMTLTPPGDSMKGANASAVVESLKQACKLHIFSMTLTALVPYIAVVQPEKIKLPLIDAEISKHHFGLFAMAISVGLLTLVALFMSDARRGARWLHSRDDAMTVGQFPWPLSRFSGKDWPSKLLSSLTRFVMAFHPLVYLFFLFGNKWPYPRWVFIASFVILVFLSGWVFFISQRFQRPILFDRKTEEERQSDLAKFAKSVESKPRQ
jgi:Pentapeptide repeats (8 copies)